jgi:hypothetical protein
MTDMCHYRIYGEYVYDDRMQGECWYNATTGLWLYFEDYHKYTVGMFAWAEYGELATPERIPGGEPYAAEKFGAFFMEYYAWSRDDYSPEDSEEYFCNVGDSRHCHYVVHAVDSHYDCC